ncbi:MAG TPA: nuclear transport factor 2 family protein [Mycobacteriales bacterium]|nr:nuclear transport factor 2 family protein [Mycobacteriales bacterium]
MATATELAATSLRLTKERDRDGWLALFAPDAVVEDPVGGGRREGIEAITAFYDSTISTVESFDYEIERSYECGSEVAVVIRFAIVAAGVSLDMDVVNIYAIAPDGEHLQSLRSWWDGSRQGA